MSEIEELQSSRLAELVERLDSRVRELEAREAIRDVLGRYCRAIDRLDHALLLSCYHPDAVDEHGFFTTHSGKDFADRAIPATEAAFERTYYSLGTILINVEGSCATSESYCFSPKILREPDEEGRRHMRIGGVRFLDRFECRNGEWRIAYRRLVGEWGIFHPTPTRSYQSFKIPPDENSPPLGRRDESDFSYELNPVRGSATNQR